MKFYSKEKDERTIIEFKHAKIEDIKDCEFIINVVQ